MIRRKITGREVEERWKTLLSRKRPRNEVTKNLILSPNDEVDPFDCSNIAVPPSKQMVEAVLADRIEKWKSLERRKVFKDVEAGAPRAKGFLVSRVRLPHHFDYESKLPGPPLHEGDKVISLQDPTKQISYEQELWKIFKDTPKIEDLKARRLRGAKCNRMQQAVEYMEANIQQAHGLQSHANVRLRMKDRHGLPDPPSSNAKVLTIRIEVWQRNLKNQPSMAAHRLELEFLSSQTLQDVHSSIVELSDDEFWDRTDEGKSTPSKTRSGFFFVEGTFYAAPGKVDYISPIKSWLDGDRVNKEFRTFFRRAYLGIQPTQEIQTKPMSGTRLDQITWRLGTRYVHVHHGDVENAIFLVDVQYCPTQPTTYPLIHDDWVPSYRAAFCDACGKSKPGAFATEGGNSRTDGSPRILCSICFDALFWDQPNTKCVKFGIWRNQFELSTGLEPPDISF